MARLDFLLKPLMGWLDLPPAAALPLIIGMLSSVYGGIAAMIVFPFSTAQMTLMAVFILTAHALIQEGIIQGQSGIHPLKATLVRIGRRRRHRPSDGPLGRELHGHADRRMRRPDGQPGIPGDDPATGRGRPSVSLQRSSSSSWPCSRSSNS